MVLSMPKSVVAWEYPTIDAEGPGPAHKLPLSKPRTRQGGIRPFT
jgi:hypothetical protein